MRGKKKKPILTEEEIREIEKSDIVLTICVIKLEDLKKLNLMDSKTLTKYLRKQSDEDVNASQKDEEG